MAVLNQPETLHDNVCAQFAVFPHPVVLADKEFIHNAALYIPVVLAYIEA